jgi:ubiquitin carboxyl-terminal hydrolase L5
MIGEWCTIESDPWTFSELTRKLGVSGVQFEEVFDLEGAKEMLTEFGSVYGFVFLFKWDSDDQVKRHSDGQLDWSNDLVFIKQIVTNACATIAVLNIAFNAKKDSSVTLSDSLRSFKEFVVDLPPDMRGMALTNSEEIRAAHNSFIALGSLNADEKEPSTKGEACHFVALVPHNQKLVEFDGMRDAPIIHCTLPEDDEIGGVLSWIKERIASVEGGDLRFSLLAMVPDQVERLTQLISENDDDVMKIALLERLENEKEKRKPPPPAVTNPAQSSHDLSDHDRRQLQQALDLIQSMKGRGLFG